MVKGKGGAREWARGLSRKWNEYMYWSFTPSPLQPYNDDDDDEKADTDK